MDPLFASALQKSYMTAALAMLGKPATFELDSNCPQFLNAQILDAARLAGRAHVVVSCSVGYWYGSDIEAEIVASLAAFSRTPGELKIEGVHRDINSMHFDIVCTDHPDPVPARKPSDEALEDDKPSEG